MSKQIQFKAILIIDNAPGLHKTLIGFHPRVKVVFFAKHNQVALTDGPESYQNIQGLLTT